MLDVALLGTGGMMPLPERHLTSLMLRLQGSSLMIDCGEGTQVALRKKGWSYNPLDVICFTHYHGDHISGLPGMLLTMGNSDRTEPLTLIGPKGLSRVVTALRVVAPELPFSIEFLEFSGDGAYYELNGYQIRAFRVRHNVPCYGYQICVPRLGAFDVEKAKRNQVPLKFWNRLQHGETVTFEDRIYTPDMVMGADRQGLKLVYATDTRPTESIVENGRDADLMILEGMYGDPEKLERLKGHKHMMLQEACRLAKEAGPKELWLTHYSPAMLHPENYEKELRSIFPHTVIPQDGQSTTLYFPEGEDRQV